MFLDGAQGEGSKGYLPPHAAVGAVAGLQRHKDAIEILIVFMVAAVVPHAWTLLCHGHGGG